MKLKNLNPLLLLFACTLTTSILYAQQPTYLDETPKYTTQTDNMLQYMYIDKFDDILYDRVFPLAALTAFNKKNVNTSSSTHFLQAYYELYHAAYNKSIFTFKPSALSNKIAVDVKNGIVPIGALSYDIKSIDTNAIEKNLLYQNGDFIYNVAGADIYAPFVSSSVYLASPLVESSTSQQVVFKLADYIFKRPSQYNLNSVDADFGNGEGMKTGLSKTTPFQIIYPTPGDKIIKFRLHISRPRQSELIFEVLAKFKVNAGISQGAVLTEGQPDYREQVSANEQYGGYTGQGTLSYYYAFNNSTKKLKKPILVLDGFDPTDGRKDVELYDKYLNRGNFAHDLRNQGYDVVVLNFPDYLPQEDQGIIIHGGGDYIQRNGTVCIAAINTLNQQLQTNGSTQKLVIIGPSMGGLISRYALKTMENRGLNHNCRLWISLDSPHNGANIAIGSQSFIDCMANFSGSKDLKDARDVSLNCPAAQQLLLSHFSPNAESVRNAFQNEMNSLGFPRNLRRIAIADGNLSGISTLGTGCEKSMTFDLTWQIYANPTISIFFGVTFTLKVNIKTFSILSAKTFFDPTRGTCQVFQATKIFATEQVGRGNPFTSYDVAPGGWTDTQGQISANGGDLNLAKDWGYLLKIVFDNSMFGSITHLSSNFYSVKPNHSFISTKSALGFSGANKDLGENIYNRNLVCTGETPFDSYYAPVADNYEHVFITPEMKSYATNEINGIIQPSSFNTNAVSPVTGDDLMCIGWQRVYTVNNIPAGATVNWTSTGPVQFVSNANSTSVIVKSVGNGISNVIANITSACGIYATSKSIRSGSVKPIINSTFTDNINTAKVYLQQDPAVTTYRWYVDNTFKTESGSTAYGSKFSTCGNHSISVGAMGTCGESELAYQGFYFECNQINKDNTATTANYNVANNTYNKTYTAFPNPASEQLVININSLTAASYVISLYDLVGKKILTYTKTVDPGVNVITLDVGKVNNGIYLLAVDNGIEIKNEKITIAH